MSLLKLPSVANAASPTAGAEDRRDHLRHRRLAVAAGDRDERHVEAAPPCGGELAERRRLSATTSPGSAGVLEAALGERGDGAGGLGVGEEGVRIEALAAQRDEEIARRDAARVAVDARRSPSSTLPTTRASAQRARAGVVAASSSSRRSRVGRRGASLARRRRGRERARCASACSRMRGVGERRLRAADVLVVLVALAGDEDDVARRAALPTAWRIASARFSITSTSSWPIAPARICARIRSGDSRRGLSLVTTTRPASRHGDRAHQRPLGRVAIAAAAEHAPERAAARRASGAQRGERLLERVGRVGVVDHDLGQARRAPRRSRRAAPRRRRAACGRAPASAPRTRVAASASVTPIARSTPMTHEQVGGVVVADQRRRDRRAARRPRRRRRRGRRRSWRSASRAQARRRAAHRDGPAVDGRAGERVGELDALARRRG